ncbi:unnamed protein product [Camellia sinensis]
MKRDSLEADMGMKIEGDGRARISSTRSGSRSCLAFCTSWQSRQPDNSKNTRSDRNVVKGAQAARIQQNKWIENPKNGNDELLDPVVAEATLDFRNLNKRKLLTNFPTFLPQAPDSSKEKCADIHTSVVQLHFIQGLSIELTMSASGSGRGRKRKNVAGNRTDPGWEHGIEIDAATKKVQCKYCNVTRSGECYDPIWIKIGLYKCLEKMKSPGDWWDSFGDECPELKRFAIRVLSLTCSSSGCERNWSAFEMVHSKRRNRLHQKRMNDLVFVMYNLKLRQRHKNRQSIMNPLCLDDVPSDDEWITEKENPTLPREGNWLHVLDRNARHGCHSEDEEADALARDLEQACRDHIGENVDEIHEVSDDDDMDDNMNAPRDFDDDFDDATIGDDDIEELGDTSVILWKMTWAWR